MKVPAKSAVFERERAARVTALQSYLDDDETSSARRRQRHAARKAARRAHAETAGQRAVRLLERGAGGGHAEPRPKRFLSIGGFKWSEFNEGHQKSGRLPKACDALHGGTTADNRFDFGGYLERFDRACGGDGNLRDRNFTKGGGPQRSRTRAVAGGEKQEWHGLRAGENAFPELHGGHGVERRFQFGSEKVSQRVMDEVARSPRSRARKKPKDEDLYGPKGSTLDGGGGTCAQYRLKHGSDSLHALLSDYSAKKASGPRLGAKQDRLIHGDPKNKFMQGSADLPEEETWSARRYYGVPGAKAIPELHGHPEQPRIAGTKALHDLYQVQRDSDKSKVSRKELTDIGTFSSELDARRLMERFARVHDMPDKLRYWRDDVTKIMALHDEGSKPALGLGRSDLSEEHPQLPSSMDALMRPPSHERPNAPVTKKLRRILGKAGGAAFGAGGGSIFGVADGADDRLAKMTDQEHHRALLLGGGGGGGRGKGAGAGGGGKGGRPVFRPPKHRAAAKKKEWKYNKKYFDKQIKRFGIGAFKR